MKDETVVFSVRLPVSLREKLLRRAEEEGRTLNNLIMFILKKAVADGKS